MSTVRQASQVDLSFMHSLYEGLAPLTAAGLSLEALRRDWRNSRSIFLAAFNGSDLIGFIGGCSLDETEGEIRYLAVKRDFWGRGTGRLLVEAFRKRMKRSSRIFLEVAESNAGALAFYERLGAKKLYFRKNYYYKGVGAWVMQFK